MSQAYFLSHILLVLLLHLPRLANPLDGPQGLVERDNEWNLKCSNAPTVVAGSLLKASDVTAPLPKVLPQSGSNQPWCKYLWCVPGTRTYLFLNTGRLDPLPSVYRDVWVSLAHATTIARIELTQQGDGPIPSRYNGYMTPDFSWSATAPTSNIEVYVRPSKGILTRGVLVAALVGLGQYVDGGYDPENMPMVFQVNYGQFGEVGIGYVGFVDPYDPERRCKYEDIQGVVGYCDDVKAGKVVN